MSLSIANKKIFLAGHNGMVGKSVYKRLLNEDAKILVASRSELDLRNQQDVDSWFAMNSPEIVIICSAKVGGINANNKFRADFIYDNTLIQSNLIHASYLYGVEKLIFLGSSCIYPKFSSQPINESELLNGKLEETNEAYAIAKIHGLKMCQSYNDQHNCNFITVMPPNLYGANDNFDLETSHVVPALLKKFHLAKTNNLPEVEIWGSGKPLREFMHVDDCADAIIFMLKEYNDREIINIGSSQEISINQLAKLIKKIVGYEGKIIYNNNFPDGTPRKILDSSKANKLGWQTNIPLEKGLEQVYRDVFIT